MKINFFLFVTLVYFQLNSLAQSVTTVTLNPQYDAFVDNINGNGNYGSQSFLEVGVKVSGSVTTVRRSYLRFNMLGIPSNAVILSAELKLNKNTEGTDVTNSSFKIERVEPVSPSQWVETGITWNNQPASATSDAISTTTSNTTHRIFNVTTHVTKMFSNLVTNYGWVIKRSSETVATLGSTYKAEEGIAIANQPQLVIQYYQPFTISAATITHASSSVALNGAISATVTNGPSSPTYQWYNGQTGLAISGATSATLSNVGSGWYGLKVTGTQGSPVFMAFIVGVKCQPFTINFNPGPDYIDDVTLIESRPSVNYGTNATIVSSYAPNLSVWSTQRFCLKFRLWLSPDFTIAQGDMKLSGNIHIFANRSNESKLSSITANWNEQNVCWTNAPSITTTNQITVPATSNSTEDRTLSIINHLNSWKSNNLQNFGVMLDLSSITQPSASMNFHSSDATVLAKRPQLDLVLDLSNYSGCQPGSIDELSYSELKSDLDGGYARTFQGKFKIHFKEEETISSGKFIPFEIYDENHLLVASSDINGNVFGSIAAIPNYSSNANYHVLDISGLSTITQGSYFTFVVKTSNGVTKYLKILKNN
jgi:hypothetical protein